MARSQDPRRPLLSQRGPKRTGDIGTILPGDDAEVARDIQRLWWELRRRGMTAMPASGDGPWHNVGDPGEPPYENGGANVIGEQQLRFRLLASGGFQLNGSYSGVPVNSTIFTLPSAFWPLKPAHLELAITSDDGYALARIETDGRVVHKGMFSATLNTAPIFNSIISAKGDLIVGSASSVAARLAVGADATVLTADSTQPLGVKWAVPAGGGGGGISFSGCRLYQTAATTLTNNFAQPVLFQGEDYDTDGYHDPVTNNSRITIPAAMGGRYRVSALVGNFWVGGGAGGRRFLQLNKNGSVLNRVETPAAAETWITFSLPYTLAAGDYLELTAFQNSGSNGVTAQIGTGYGDGTTFSIERLS